MKIHPIPFARRGFLRLSACLSRRPASAASRPPGKRFGKPENLTKDGRTNTDGGADFPGAKTGARPQKKQTRGKLFF